MPLMLMTIDVRRLVYQNVISFTRHSSRYANGARTTSYFPNSLRRSTQRSITWQRRFNTTQSFSSKSSNTETANPQFQEDDNEIETTQTTSKSHHDNTDLPSQSSTTTTHRSSSSSSTSSSSSSPHNTLKSFLNHANPTSLSKTSTTYLGTLYEYLILNHFTKNLSFNLTRTGGRGDSGIDLIGTWTLPSILASQSHHTYTTTTKSSTPSPQTNPPTSIPIPILIQCKRLTTTKPGPNLIRELEGSFRGAPSTHRGPSTLGIMVCSRPATKGIRDAIGRSRRGLVWCFVDEFSSTSTTTPSFTAGSSNSSAVNDPETSHDDGDEAEEEDETQEEIQQIPNLQLKQFLYNQAAAMYCGLEGVDVSLKYSSNSNDNSNNTRGVNNSKTTGEDKEVILLYQGRPITFPPPSPPSNS